MTLIQKLIQIQSHLHCPKDRAVMNYNGSKQYDYRNLAGIYERVKPLLKTLNCALVVDCRPVVVGAGVGLPVDERDRGGNVIGAHVEGGARIYQEATATLIDGESDGRITCTASARENEWRRGMDASQISGAAESFAAKYALEHLFAIDSTDDADDMAAKDAASAAAAAAGTHVTPVTVVAAAKRIVGEAGAKRIVGAASDDDGVCPCGSVKGKRWADIESATLEKILAMPPEKAQRITDGHRVAIRAEIARRAAAEGKATTK